MKKRVWAVAGPVIVIAGPVIVIAGLALAGLGVRGWPS